MNKNVNNHFNETEQAAFSPGNFVPGIEPVNDRLLQGRMFAYPDAQRYRLGVNHNQIPINNPTFACPYAVVKNYQQDGLMNMNPPTKTVPNYEPNSFNGPVADPAYKVSPI